MKVFRLISSDKKTGSKNDVFISLFIWYMAIAFLLFLAVYKETVIPKYFFFDANTIADYIQYAKSLVPGDSFANTALFYKVLGVGRTSFVFSILAAIIIVFGFYIHVKNRTNTLSFIDIALLYFYMLLSVIYMTLLSKDFIVFLIILPFLYLTKKRTAGLICWTILAAFYAFYFRTYWFLFLGVFWGLYLVCGLINKTNKLFIICILALLFLAIVLQIALGVDVDNFRKIVNDVRLDQGNENANSMILPFIPGGGLIVGWLNVSLTWISFMLPFPLILSLSLYYIVISLLVIMLYYKFWYALKIELQKNKKVRNNSCIALACLILSFTLTQSLFEPDYGSYVRHLAPFYPLFFYVIFANKSNSIERDDESSTCG
ncbi:MULTISPECIES: hypothetical protein [Klebsiella]|nr:MULTISPECIES: hypothetical protein [Klebsiella]HCI6751181.1 hypothetical protein [Klebsiella quasipneumoniae subsp. quasipneumoniae]MBC5065766.1 hypothetical protein [Klebsiella quasipneumoniae]MBC5145666.1 hypothetical protein [Klebsiella quasipneumoniae]MCQ3876079.1 hypothetical protein [Klebsiella variicola]MCQ3913593.1 hypothetical protein [Klebsiella variicola]